MNSIRLKQIITLAILIALSGYWWYFMLTTPESTFINWLPYIPPSYDADMAYVYNSILPFEGYSYAHVYHPGTAMHIVGTVVAAFAYPVARWQGTSLAAFHAMNPFPLLFALRMLVGTLAAVTSMLLFRLTAPEQSRTGWLLGGAVGIAFYAVYEGGFVSLVSWSHASMGYAFGGLLMLATYRMVVSGKPITRARYWTIGLLCGVLTATAYYYAPWVLGVMVSVGGVMLVRQRGMWRALLASIEVGILSLVGFMLANAPIWHKFNEFVNNVIALASAQGIHGAGEPGFTSFISLQNGAALVYGVHPLLFWALGGVFGVAGVVLIVQRKRLWEQATLWILLLGYAAHVIFALFLVFKHPGGSYLNTTAPVIPLLLAVLFKLMDTPYLRRGALAIAAIIAVLFIRQYVNVVGLHWQTIQTAEQRQVSIAAFVDEYASAHAQHPDDVLILTTYGTHFGCYGMWFGSGYTQHRLHDYVARACPSILQFEGGLDGARTLRNEWMTLDDPRFCWDVAILEQYYGQGMLAQYSEPVVLTGGITAVTNNSLYAPVNEYVQEFDTEFCGNGWHAPQVADDMTYMWMAEPVSAIGNLKLTTNTNYTLTVTVFATIAPDVLASFLPHVNGEPIVLVPGENAGEFVGEIPATVVKKNDTVTQLTFHIAETQSPGAENGDPRQLGVALDRVVIEPVAISD